MARFIEVDPDDESVDLYEWIVGHELAFAQPRVFHICTRHALAELTPSFRCPFADATCPMRAMVDACPNRRRPRTWLGATGWRRHGLIRLDERPRAPR